ncbi:recombinase family protein [Nitrosomonas aestuarii]|uniref:recombinase family protein n=1 Tax=Nitrosomonas aestuarii TaxID=52441 RepID=UPI000D2FBAA0|nr:recombinase family protein [Nitrosomonas aestuarii]PTN09706.1 DNA invertase Pin-like site-specific DNA recombinase [Nitrosomonas aestuarii]
MLIGYARVSTLDQNPELQIDALNEAGCKKIFTEKVSGASKDRKQLQQALDFMRKGDTLVIWKLSRLARSLTQIINTVKDLEERQIGLKVLTQNIDTATPEGRLFFHMNAAFDQFQREIIVENTRAGLKSARKNGRIGGRPTLMTDEKIRTAQAMLKDTENYLFVSDIIKALGIGRTTFYRHFTPEKIEQLRPQQ